MTSDEEVEPSLRVAERSARLPRVLACAGVCRWSLQGPALRMQPKWQTRCWVIVDDTQPGIQLRGTRTGDRMRKPSQAAQPESRVQLPGVLRLLEGRQLVSFVGLERRTSCQGSRPCRGPCSDYLVTFWRPFLARNRVNCAAGCNSAGNETGTAKKGWETRRTRPDPAD